MQFGTPQQNSSVLTGDAEYRELQEKKAQLHTDISVYGADLDKIKKQISEHSDLTSECEKLKESILDLEEKKDGTLKEINNLQKEKDILVGAIGSKQADLDSFSDVKDKISEKETELKKLTEVILDTEQKFEKKKNQLQEKIKDLEADVSDLEADAINFNNVLKDVKDELEVSKKLVVDKNLEVQNLTAQIKDLGITVSSLTQDISNLKDEKLSLEKENDKAVDEILEKKNKANDEIKLEYEKLEEAKRAMEIREGDASRHEDVLESRVNYLRNVKTRLEHHLGKSIDLNIE